METPKLCEPAVKSILHSSLKDCNLYKQNYYNLLFNIVTAIIFISIVSLLLWLRYKGRLTEKEIEEKKRIKNNYIISKLAKINSIKKQKDNFITNLPSFKDNPEINILISAN